MVEDLDPLAAAIGCPRIRVLAVKPGALAAEIIRRLAGESAG